jgi:hypothetical protein
MLSNKQRTLYSVQSTIYIVQSAVCSVQCAVCSVHGAVCSVLCAVYSLSFMFFSDYRFLSLLQYFMFNQVIMFCVKSLVCCTVFHDNPF